MKKSAVSKAFVIFAILFFAGNIFVSCEKNVQTYSFASTMEIVDELIKSNEATKALNLLKKSEKYAFDPSSRIGMYKRFNLLGEKKFAEKILKKSVKKFPESLELCALYGHFLIRNGKLDEALKVTEKLSDSKYSSVYSEAVLKKHNSNTLESYLSLEFADVYKSIYEQTKNVRWLMNAALVHLMRGNYVKASLTEEPVLKSGKKLVSLLESDEALFWAMVQFDAGNYDVALRNISAIRTSDFLPLASTLASDCYVKLDEFEQAERARSVVISSEISEIPDVVAVNSAIWSYLNKQYARSYSLLTGVLERNPEYVPALLTFGKLAWEDSKTVEISDLEKTVRETSLRTEKMKEDDARPRFSIDEAISRLLKVEEIYREKNKLEENKETPIDVGELIAERLSLYLRVNKTLPIKAKTAELWKALEQNEIGLNLYPSKVVHFAVRELLLYGFVDDARSLFTNYINAKYLKKIDEKNKKSKDDVDIFGGIRNSDSKDEIPVSVVRLAFGEKVAASVSSMETWEIEVAAYFSLIDGLEIGNVESAKILYDYVLFNSNDGYNPGNVSVVSSCSAAMNLAMILSSSGEDREALALYGQAAGKCLDSHLKSKILQRIAVIQMRQGDVAQAKLSIDYSLALDPENADARLFRRQISE